MHFILFYLSEFVSIIQMILDIQESPFHQDQDLLNHTSQPDHQQAIRALMANNQQLFLQILNQHPITSFTLTPYTVISQTLDIEQKQVKQKFNSLFNLKFAQLLQASEDRGRFFQNPQQLTLHNYARYQYFEDKNRAKADKSITNAYLSIFERITNLDDFIYFTDFAVASVVRQPFQHVQSVSRNFLDQSGEFEKNLKIYKLLETGSQEEKLIIQYCFCVIALNSAKKQKMTTVDKITEIIQDKLKNQPLKLLLKACLQLCPLNFIEDVLDKHPRQLIDFDYHNNISRLNSQYLHPDLCGYDTFAQYFKKMNSLQQLIQKYQVIAKSAKLIDNKVYLGINYDLLSYQQDDLYSKYSYTKKVSIKTISEYSEFLNLLSNNISLEFVAIQQQRQTEKHYNVMYACKSFEIFVIINKLKNIRSQHALFEHILVTWGRLFTKWLEIDEIKNQNYLIKGVKAYFSLLLYIERHQQFPSFSNFQSEVSKTIFDLLSKLQTFPCDLTFFRGLKTILFRWALQHLADTTDLRLVLKKFIACYFSDELTIRPNSNLKDDLFQAPGLCKVVRSVFGVQIIEHVNRRYQRIYNQKIESANHPKGKYHALFFTKIGYIISSKILGEASESFGFELMKYYLNYAHVWPLLHSFRLWLLLVSRDSIEIKIDQKINELSDLWKILHNQIQTDLKQKRQLSIANLSRQTLQVFNQFYHLAHIHINGLRLKRNKDTINKQTYWKHFLLLLDMKQKLQGFKSEKQVNENSFQEWITQGFCIHKQIYTIFLELKLTFRFSICNSLRFLQIQEEESIMFCVGKLMIKAVQEKNDELWPFICDILGINDLKCTNSHINSKQIMGHHQKYTAKISSKLDQFVSFNFICALYASIRPKFKLILKYILKKLKQNQELQDLWSILQKIMFSPVIISGSCIFNGLFVEKTKQDMAFGLYYDQFQNVTDLLTTGQNTVENTSFIILLQKKKKIFSRFFEILKSKNVKIRQRARPNPSQNRYRSRNMSAGDVINAMIHMGVSQEEAQIALQNIEYPDQNLAMEWIDNNQDRIQELIVNRTLQRTRQQHSRKQSKKDPPLLQNQIQPLSFDRFYEKEKMIKLSRVWIKIIFKQIFREENMKESQTLKELMFLFLDSLKKQQSQNQYNNLNEKIYSEIDELNKSSVIPKKIILFISILEGSFNKTDKARNDFYKNSINLKILSYIPRIDSEQIIIKVFSLINTTLPVFNNNDLIGPQLQEYLSYLLDLVLKYRSNHKSFSQIMLKIAKSGKPILMKKITRNITIFFRQNLIKQNIFSIINMIFESDKQFSKVNAELDLKTYLYQRYKHRLFAFHPDKEHVLQIDIKEYLVSFQKYDKGSAIYDVSKQMMCKKKNKNRYFYYDCRNEKNAFDHSHYGDCTFLKYPVKQHFKTIIRSLLVTLFQAKSYQVEEDVLTDLYKLLYNYRILLPYTISEQVANNNLIDWLLFSQNKCKRKFKFLTFLTLNVNLFVHLQGYRFSSLSDYVSAKIISNIIKSNKNKLWTSFTALALAQVKRFSELSQASLSKQNEVNIIQHYQKLLKDADPLQYVTISQFLFIQYRRRMIDNLRRKYKFASSQAENAFDRQFLNISPFFNSISIKHQKIDKVQSSVQMAQDQMDEEDEDSPQMMFFEEENRRLAHRRNLLLNQTQQNQIQQLIVPLPPPISKQAKEQQGQQHPQKVEELQPIIIKNWQFLQDIIIRFDKYLSFEQQRATAFDIQEATLPQQPILLLNFNNGFVINVEQANLDIDLKIKKLIGFQNKIVQVYNLIAPKLTWEIKKKEPVVQDRQAFISLGRRLIQNLNNSGGLEHNRDTLLTLQRLMQGRYNRQEYVNTAPVRTLNVNDIYQHMEQFAQPIRPVLPPSQPKPESMVIQEPPKQQQVRQDIQIVELPAENIPIIDVPPLIAQELEIQNQQNIDNLHALEIQEINQDAVVLPQLGIEAAQIPPIIQQHNPNIPIVPVLLEPLPQEVPQQNQPVQQPQADLIIQQPQQNDQPIVQPPPPPAHQREILRMLGLSQSFLRDVGLDQQFFDSLPQDLQQEQLMQFISQQGASLNRRPSNNNPGQNPIIDQQTENLAFLESLDPQTRAQILIEATPQFLAALPVNVREQAQRYRHLQANRMMEEEQIEEERNYAVNIKSKAVVYQQVKKEQFSNISDEAAQAIFRGVFNIYPKLKISAVKILLENKITQEKTLSTIIALINYFQADDEEERKINIHRVQLSGKQHKITSISKWTEEQMGYVRTYLLHIIYEHIKIPLYKDDNFLKEKIGTAVYCQQLAEFIENQDDIDPIVELASYALNYYPDLATELVKKAKTLPTNLLIRIVDGIRKQFWPTDFYDSLQNLSDNEQLKELFSKQFELKPPKIQILGKLLKYKFAHLHSLKKIHQDALEYYSTTYLQFLNQIFSIYTLDTLHQIEPLLVKHKQIHFQVIKNLLQNGKEIEKEPIGIILKKPHLLDFQTKKFIFRSHPKLRKVSNGRRVHIEVDRTHLFQGSYNQLMSRSVRELEGKIQVSFINQPGYDAGGLKRQWFLLVSRQIFNQDYALFEKSSSGSTYQPNPKSYINPDHLNYFKFIGRFIAKSLIERQLVDAYFTRAFYKMIIGQQLQFKDLEAQDYDFYKSMQWLKNNKIDQGIFTFSYIYDNFGNKIEKELIPGGKGIVVTQQNKIEYIEKYCMSKMRDDFSTQINKFLQGFYEVIPQECISYFQAKQIELLISGVPEVDFEDMKKNTDYSGYNPTDQIIVWFWQVVAEYSQEDLAKLVQFITGTSKIPMEGFSHMIGMNGIQRISIHRDPCDHQLPKSHTCFNQLDLPNYATKEILKEKLGICLAWGSEGFGFM